MMVWQFPVVAIPPQTSRVLLYARFPRLVKALSELRTYIVNNWYLIPNYSERYHNGEAIATRFVESTVNEVVSRRFCKKQQMQWSKEGAHLFGLDHMKVYTCGKKFLPTSPNRSMPIKSMAKANHPPKYDEWLSL
jgi:hypothetical protein